MPPKIAILDDEEDILLLLKDQITDEFPDAVVDVFTCHCDLKDWSDFLVLISDWKMPEGKWHPAVYEMKHVIIYSGWLDKHLSEEVDQMNKYRANRGLPPLQMFHKPDLGDSILMKYLHSYIDAWRKTEGE